MFDIEEIKKKFADVVTFSQGIPDPQIDDLFQRWYDAKKRFIDMMDGQLIKEIEMDMSFALDEKSKNIKFAEFVNYVDDGQHNNFVDFLHKNKEGFFNNQVICDYEDKIPKGMKLVKAFKFFEPNKHRLETYQNRASQIIQEDKVTGKLCISVHPLDFLSLSENTYNWHSCHALDGEYRAGNLSYMGDKVTIICYIKGKDGVKLPLFPENVLWNSKKWRMLCYISEKENIVFAGRQYPFASQEAMAYVKQMLIVMMNKNKGIKYNFSNDYSGWTDPLITSVEDSYEHEYGLKNKYIAIRGRLEPLDEIVIDSPNPLHFNDVLRSSYYRPHYFAWANVPWHDRMTDRLYVGSDCNCLRCNEQKITTPEIMMCDDCEFKYGTEVNDIFGECDCCGRRVYTEDLYEVGDDLVCPDCRDSECFECEECGEIWYNGDACYSEEYGYICPECNIRHQIDRVRNRKIYTGGLI